MARLVRETLDVALPPRPAPLGNPQVLAEAREWVSRPDGGIAWQDGEDGYKYAETLSVYGNVPQRWLLVYSEQGYAREKKTLEKNLEKQEAQLTKEMRQLGSAAFGCVHDAEVEVAKLRNLRSRLKEAGETLPNQLNRLG